MAYIFNAPYYAPRIKSSEHHKKKYRRMLISVLFLKSVDVIKRESCRRV
ncbi:MAG: hypothetical protein LBR15_07305 [Methanobrevibacter sp.]|nr:hypothetical protein [Candidatus Methanovirga australis]